MCVFEKETHIIPPLRETGIKRMIRKAKKRLSAEGHGLTGLGSPTKRARCTYQFGYKKKGRFC